MLENISSISVLLVILILLTVYFFFRKIIKLEQAINELKNNFIFHQNYFIEYEEEKNKNFNQNEEKSKFLTYYSLLLFSSKIKNFIAFVRIVTFRKIANILLIIIIEKNKKYLKRTSSIFIDMLKPKDNQKKFSIIYCCENMPNGVKKHKFNIIIDFLMYIYDYSSMIIENSPDGINSYNKTDVSSVPTNELVDYVFNAHNIENETKKLINKIEKEELIKIVNEKENKENIKNKIIEHDIIINNKNEDNDEIEEKEMRFEDNTKNKEFLINKEAKDNSNKKNEKETEKEKEKLVQNLKNKFILKDETIEEKDLKLIQKILLKSNKIICIKELIKLYNETFDDKNKLKNASNIYKNKIDNYKCNFAKEFTIEEILENYKLQFDTNFKLYKNKNINIKKHYRFDTYYRKIIKLEELKNIDLNTMKEDIKKLLGNDLIDNILEDKEKFGNDLKIEDF